MNIRLAPIQKIRARSRGLTILETLIAVGIGTVLVAGAMSLSLYGARSLLAIGNFADMSADSRQALDLLSRELRQASAVIDLQTNSTVRWLTVTNNTSAGMTNRVTWDSTTRTLALKSSWRREQILLAECDRWDIRLFSRVVRPVSTGFTYCDATNWAGQLDLPTSKMIEMTWICSRTNQGQKIKTENLQRLRIGFRNRPK